MSGTDCLGCDCSPVDFVTNFLSVNRYFGGACEAKFHLISVNPEYRHFDVPTDNHSLSAFTLQN
jgi:hypothetical protein